MKCAAIYVWTHDSIGLGEDGPTHQPIEHLAALRAIPGLSVVRPGDANETAHAGRVAVEAGIAMPWHRFVGDAGRIVSIEHYGASADAATLFEKFGFTGETVA